MVKIPEGNFVEYEGDIVHPHDIKGADGLIIDDTLITEEERRENSRVKQEELYEIMLAEQEAYEAERAARNRTLPEVAETGPSVRLDDRAIALAAIMKYFNQVNKGSGVRGSRGHNEFNNRYGSDADDILRRMITKENRLYVEFMKSVRVLTASDDMRAVGYPEEAIKDGERQMARSLHRRYGPGNAYSPERNKLVDRAHKAAGLPTPSSQKRKKS